MKTFTEALFQNAESRSRNGFQGIAKRNIAKRNTKKG